MIFQTADSISSIIDHKMFENETNSLPNQGVNSEVHGKIRAYIIAGSQQECAKIASSLDDDIMCAGHACTLKQIEYDFLSQERIASSVAALYSDEESIKKTGHLNIDVLITETHVDDVPLWKHLRKIKFNYPDMDLLVYTTSADPSDINLAIHSGATGYILKGDVNDVSASIRLIKGGGSPVSPVVAREVLKTLRQQVEAEDLNVQPHRRPSNSNSQDVACADSLSVREKEILLLLSKGLPFSSVGELLGISHHTVTAHVKKIYRKLQVHSRSEAVYEAACLGIIPQKSLP